MTERYIQRAEISVEHVDEAVFLISDQTGSIVHLNALGGAYWRLLAAPTSLDEAIEVISLAFPETGRETIRADVGSLHAELLRRDLIRETS